VRTFVWTKVDLLSGKMHRFVFTFPFLLTFCTDTRKIDRSRDCLTATVLGLIAAQPPPSNMTSWFILVAASRRKHVHAGLLGKPKTVDPLQAALTAAQLQGDKEREQRERDKQTDKTTQIASTGGAHPTSSPASIKELNVPTFPIDICELYGKPPQLHKTHCTSHACFWVVS
jgi:hypothetical protein